MTVFVARHVFDERSLILSHFTTTKPTERTESRGSFCLLVCILDFSLARLPINLCVCVCVYCMCANHALVFHRLQLQTQWNLSISIYFEGSSTSLFLYPGCLFVSLSLLTFVRSLIFCYFSSLIWYSLLLFNFQTTTKPFEKERENKN